MMRPRSWLLLFVTTLMLNTAFAISPYDAEGDLDLSLLPLSFQKMILEKLKVSVHEKNDLLPFLDQSLKDLQKTMSFDHVELHLENQKYTFKTVKATRISKINFEGIKFFSENDLLRQMTLKEQDLFLNSTIADQGEILKNFYIENGFSNIQIDFTWPELEAHQDRPLTIKIQEGPQTIIKKIDYLNISSDLQRALNKKTISYLNDPMNETVMNNIQISAKEVFRKKFYLRAQLVGPEITYNSTESESYFTYHIINPSSYRIQYQGNTSYSRIRLDEELDLKNFFTMNPAVGNELAQKLKAFYLSQGFARVEITAIEVPTKKSGQQKILLTINEGSKVKINQIIFSGRLSRPSQFYEDQFFKNSPALISKRIYHRDEIELTIKNLITELQNTGYIQAKVVSMTSQFNKDRTSVNLLINIDEGPRSMIQNIDFIGNTHFTHKELIAVLDLTASTPLILPKVELALQKLKNLYYEAGYIEMQMIGEKEDLIIYDDVNNTARLKFKILEGPQVKVGSLLFEGNTYTSERILKIELELHEGDIVTPSKIEESVARLQRTGFFSSVEIKTLEERTQVSERTLVVRVNEKDPGVFAMGFGATNERSLTLRGYLGLSYKNILGTGRGLSVRLEGTNNIADINFLEQKLTFGYAEPYILGSRYRGKWNLAKAKYVTDYDLKKVTDLTQQSISIEKDFTSHVIIGWDLWNLARYHDFGIDESLNIQNNIQNTEQVIAATGPTIDIDFRNSPFNPTAGTLTKFSAEYATPDLGSSTDIEYLKTMLSLSHYLDVYSGEVIWANQIRAGILQNLSPSSSGGVPWDKKGFSIGGRSTLRGFSGGEETFPNRAELGVTDTYSLRTKSEMYLIKSEVRFPLFGILGGVVFYDGGSVQIQGLQFEDSYRDSAGFGLRINTPVGAVNAEFGFKLDRKTNRPNPNGGSFSESPYAFHLSFGSF